MSEDRIESKPVVLCVDDDPDILTFLRIVLVADGFDVVAAASAEEGLVAYQKSAPDLVIIDMMMEEVDAGTGLVKELRLRGNVAPVFLLSSIGDDLSLTTDTYALGLAGVFQKPIDRSRLLKVLRAALPAVSA